MDAGVGHQVGLELSQVGVEGTVESERGSQRGDALGNDAVEVGVGGLLDVQVPADDVVHGLRNSAKNPVNCNSKWITDLLIPPHLPVN